MLERLNYFQRKLFNSHLIFFRLASAAFYGNMVRHFKNPYKDYSPEKEVYINNDEILMTVHNYLDNILKHVKPTHRNVDGGLYVGTTGVAYMLYRLSKYPDISAQDKQYYVEKSMEYIMPGLAASNDVRASDKTSFLLGNIGTFAVAAAIYYESDPKHSEVAIKAIIDSYEVYLDPKFIKCGANELFVGRAGYIAGLYWLNKELKVSCMPLENVYRICDVIVESGKAEATKCNSPCPLMYSYYKTMYVGAAHGICYILQLLISCPGYIEYKKQAAVDIKSTIDYILSIQTPEGNWPASFEEVKMPEHKLVHWCHGAPGVIYLMAKSYLVYGEQKYLEACKKAADLVWEKGLLKKGPGICHGVAGNGYVFLMMYRLTKDRKYLYRAKCFANFLKDPEFGSANVPDCPYSLYEGLAGTVCFLLDLTKPETAEFPFQDVFTVYDL